jgi:hypothetical protein
MRKPMKQKARVMSDQQKFFAGEIDDSLGLTLDEFIKNIGTGVVAQTQDSLVTAGTNLINNQVAKNPALQQKSANAIGDTIKEAILKNKWYIVGGLAGLAIMFVVLNKYSMKKSQA